MKSSCLLFAAFMGSFVFLLTLSQAEGPATLDPALGQAIANNEKTAGEAQRYAYTEHKRDRNLDSSGAVKSDSTETYEIIFLEGAPYKKHTLHNDEPLALKEQKAEDRKLADVTKARRKNKDKTGLLRAQFHLELPIDQIPARFDVTASGTEEIDGRKVLVFNALPLLCSIRS